MIAYVVRGGKRKVEGTEITFDPGGLWWPSIKIGHYYYFAPTGSESRLGRNPTVYYYTKRCIIELLSNLQHFCIFAKCFHRINYELVFANCCVVAF